MKPVSPNRLLARLHRSQTRSVQDVRVCQATMPTRTTAKPARERTSPLALMPTTALLRSLFFTSILSSRLLLGPALSAMRAVANSKTALADPDRNPVLHGLLRTTIYRHFCAGRDEAEVRRTVSHMRRLGFTGVILGYAREAVASGCLSPGAGYPQQQKQQQKTAMVEQWKQGNLRTLAMLGPGDYLAIKLTGAGPAAVEALRHGDKNPPQSIREALDAICSQAAQQGARLWIDAEQQIFQPAIDEWAIALMRRWNRSSTSPAAPAAPVVFNTVQAYLKASPQILQRQLELARAEHWTLSVKLVRGAYIAHEPGLRWRIHDSKSDTDANYDFLVESLLSRRYPLPGGATPTIATTTNGPPQQCSTDTDSRVFPDVRLVVASHNAESVRKAYMLHRSRVLGGQPTVPVEFGQLQGMADEISCELLAESRRWRASSEAAAASAAAPRALKCLAWGSVSECLQFLLRRAEENRGAVQRTKQTADVLRRELWRRLLRKAEQ